MVIPNPSGHMIVIANSQGEPTLAWETGSQAATLSTALPDESDVSRLMRSPSPFLMRNLFALAKEYLDCVLNLFFLFSCFI